MIEPLTFLFPRSPSFAGDGGIIATASTSAGDTQFSFEAALQGGPSYLPWDPRIQQDLHEVRTYSGALKIWSIGEAFFVCDDSWLYLYHAPCLVRIILWGIRSAHGSLTQNLLYSS